MTSPLPHRPRPHVPHEIAGAPITPEEAARRLGLDQVVRNPKLVVLKMARRGDIRAVRVSKFTMIDPASIDTYLHPDSGRRKAVG